MTAKSILGEDAREKILRQEIDAVTKVGDRYNELKGTLASSNEETAQNFEEYIGDANSVGTVIYRIHQLREEIAALQSKTVEVRVNTVTTNTTAGGSGYTPSGGTFYGDETSIDEVPIGGNFNAGDAVKIISPNGVPFYDSDHTWYVYDVAQYGYNTSGGSVKKGEYRLSPSPGADPIVARPGSELVRAYASGTLGTTSGLFKINELGLEALVTPSGTVMSAPTTGYGVIKNEYTKRLTDFAADPLGFLSKAFSGYSGTYQNNQSTNETININGDIALPNVNDGLSFVDSIKTLAIQYTTRRK